MMVSPRTKGFTHSLFVFYSLSSFSFVFVDLMLLALFCASDFAVGFVVVLVNLCLVSSFDVRCPFLSFLHVLLTNGEICLCIVATWRHFCDVFCFSTRLLCCIHRRSYLRCIVAIHYSLLVYSQDFVFRFSGRNFPRWLFHTQLVVSLRLFVTRIRNIPFFASVLSWKFSTKGVSVDKSFLSYNLVSCSYDDVCCNWNVRWIPRIVSVGN